MSSGPSRLRPKFGASTTLQPSRSTAAGRKRHPPLPCCSRAPANFVLGGHPRWLRMAREIRLQCPRPEPDANKSTDGLRALLISLGRENLNTRSGTILAILKNFRFTKPSSLLKSKTLPIAALCLASFFSSAALAQGARLFSYPSSPPNVQALGAKENSNLSQIKARKTTVSVTFIQLDAAALNNNILQIPLPDGTLLTLINSLRETPLPGTNTWAGRSSDGFGRGVFSLHQGNVVGRFSVGAQEFRIDSYGNSAHVLVKIDSSRLPPAHEPDTTPSEKKKL